MDSVTQFALGATIGTAVLGRRVGLRKAAITGGLLATLPDLDVFWPEDSPVDSFVTHRSATHSLIMHTLFTPVLGEALRRTMTGLKDLPWRQGAVLAWSVVFLALTTHAFLDATTIYGTQLLWPLNRIPYAVGSMFIIDPLYTLPLLVMTMWALFQGQWRPLYGKWMIVSLFVTSTYLGWSMAAQTVIEDRGRKILAAHNQDYSQIIATPMPLNTLLWRVIAVDGDRYYNIYLSMLDRDATPPLYEHARLSPGVSCWFDQQDEQIADVQRLAQFSQGFYSLIQKGDDMVYSDLRMGLTPFYAFRFKVADVLENVITAERASRLSGPRNGDGDWAWLKASVAGPVDVRPAEQAQVVTSGEKSVASLGGAKNGRC